MDPEDLDHPDDLKADALDEESQEVFPLFAEALDPNSSVTVEDVEREWST